MEIAITHPRVDGWCKASPGLSPVAGLSSESQGDDDVTNQLTMSGGRAIAFLPPATSSEPNREDHLRHFVRQVFFESRFLVNSEDDLRRSVISIGFPSCAGARIVGSFRMRNRHSPRTTIGPEAYSYCRVLGGRFVLCARYFCAGSLNSQPCTPNLKHSQGPCSEPP